ncbi:MAG: glycoside hydrolase [Deltaproteobacteria bacterium]|nr:glycoside hydrolase [Deltaproteobacteria bacterium]
MSRVFSNYVEKARRILDQNWTGSYTKPAPALYPHQWNWDSAFIAMGRSHYDTPRAMLEIETLFDAQWQNGMAPQIVFSPDALGHYFPEPDLWQTERSPHAPPGKLTSGITMPPIHAVAVERVYRNARRPRGVLPFLERIYPKLLALHAYLYRERDPNDEGLVYIRHPWESGVDNSPTWDAPFRRIEVDRVALPPYQRKDLDHGVDPKMRPSDEDYDRYVYLVDLFRRCDYDEDMVRESCPFLVQDPLFNSVLCRANESLAQIATLIGESPDLPRFWAEKTAVAIRQKLWRPEHNIFDCYDLVADTPIEVDTAAGFLPLFAGAASKEQAEFLYQQASRLRLVLWSPPGQLFHCAQLRHPTPGF